MVDSRGIGFGPTLLGAGCRSCVTAEGATSGQGGGSGGSGGHGLFSFFVCVRVCTCVDVLKAHVYVYGFGVYFNIHGSHCQDCAGWLLCMHMSRERMDTLCLSVCECVREGQAFAECPPSFDAAALYGMCIYMLAGSCWGACVWRSRQIKRSNAEFITATAQDPLICLCHRPI